MQIVGVNFWSGPHNKYSIDDIQVINPLFADFVSQTYKDICIFNNIISQHTDGTDKSPQWSFITRVLVIKTKVTYALAMQGTRASGAIVLTLVYVIVAYSVEEGPTHTHIYLYIWPEWHFFIWNYEKSCR